MSAIVGLAKDGREDGKRGSMVENGTERDGGGLNWWEVCDGMLEIMRHCLIKVLSNRACVCSKRTRQGPKRLGMVDACDAQKENLLMIACRHPACTKQGEQIEDEGGEWRASLQ